MYKVPNGSTTDEILTKNKFMIVIVDEITDTKVHT